MDYKKYTLEDLPFPSMGTMLKVYFKKNRTCKSSLARILGNSPNCRQPLPPTPQTPRCHCKNALPQWKMKK